MTQENPPLQPVFGSSPPSPTVKMPGNSRCQWKNRYWRASVGSVDDCCPARLWFFGQGAQGGVGDALARSCGAPVLGWTKAAHQASATSLAAIRSGSCFEFAPGVGAGAQLGEVGGGAGVGFLGGLVELAGFDVEGFGAEVEGELVGVGLAFGFVAGLEFGGPVLVVVAEGDERGVGDVVFEQRRGGAEQGVADAEVGVEERQGAAGVEGFQPQRDFGDLDGQVVEVDPVEAAFDDVGGGGADGGGAGFGVAGADFGQRGADAAGGGDDEMSAAAGGVDDGELQQRLLSASDCVRVPR